MNWMKLNKYCELTGDTPDSVQKKRKRGIWVDGVQCKPAPDGNIWVDKDAVDQWVMNGNKSIQEALNKAA